MMWTWDSLTFLTASLLVTVYVTVKIVEARHVASVILDNALAASHYRPRAVECPASPDIVRSNQECGPIGGVDPWPTVDMDETVGESRHHFADETEETGDNPYSARSILARFGIELAAIESSYIGTTENEVMRIIHHVDDDIPTDRFLDLNTRLFTHGYEAHR